MIITLPRHVMQNADLSARARIQTISRLLLATAHLLARLDDKLKAPNRIDGLNDHLRRDIGQELIHAKPVMPSVNDVYVG